MTNAAAINGSTLPHEVGHNFFLYHTHGHPGHEQELVNGSNCGNAGDLLCDTPAEPYNDDNGISGYVYANTCQYFGTFRDQNNELFTPDTRNFMGYAPANCRNRFSNQQINKMNQTLSTYLYDLLTIPVTVTNRIGTNNAGGTLTINNQLVASGGSIELEADVMHLGKTNHERLQGNNKHKNWDEDNAQYRLQEAFEAKRERPARDAYFVGLNPVIITTQLIETSIAGGYVEFRDPWYLADASNNQPNQFLRYSVPFSPTGAYNQNTGGVFLDQSGPSYNWDPPYYSVGVASVQNIELPHTGRVHQFYFQGWSATPAGSAEFQNANALETPVVFKQEGAVVSANYKGTQLSNNPYTYVNNGQRKFVYAYLNHLYNVYESNEKIWIDMSYYNGRTWFLGNGGKPISLNEAKSPSIAVLTNGFVMVTFQERSGIYGNCIKAAILDYSDGRIITSSVVYDLGMNGYDEIDVNPNIICANYFDRIFVIVGKEQYLEPFSVGGIWYKVLRVNLTPTYNIEILSSGLIPSTDDNSVNPSLVVKEGTYAYPVRIHLTWEQKRYDFYSDIYYSELLCDQNGNITVSQRSIISDEYRSNQNNRPSITMNGDRVVIGWIGHDIFTENSTAVFTELGSGVYYEYSGKENVNSININKATDNDFVFAWAFTDENINNMYIRGSNPNMIKSSNTNGYYVQVNNADDFNSCFIMSYNVHTSPFYFIQSNSIGSLGKENFVNNNFGRIGVVSKGKTKFNFALRDIKVDGVNIGFEPIPDSIIINPPNGGNLNLNKYLVTEPFSISNNTRLEFTVQYSVSDSVKSKSLLKGNKFVQFKVDLIDAQTQQIIKSYKTLRFDKVKYYDKNTLSYNLDLSGIRNRNVKLRVLVSDNLNGNYGITNFYKVNNPVHKENRDSIPDNVSAELKEYALYQNYPNPFNPLTKIRFSIKETNPVMINLYDIVGREVALIMNEVKDAGEYEIELDAGRLGLSSGGYFYQMKAGEYTSIKKMTYLK